MMLLSRIKKCGAVLLLVVMLSNVAAPLTVQAQWAVLDAGNIAQSTITAISTAASNISEYYTEYKESILDGLAWALAKSILQSMTSDIVDWINNGFEGNPAFVSNPEGFFLDAADQFTGEFLAVAGTLDALCSPFSVDIRLSLALNLAQRQRARYACTLSTVINNAANAQVNVNGNVSINGQNIHTVEGFMGGDFRQGGWAAFTTMTTQPQNNVYGAYIQAESEMRATLAQRQGNIQLDLAMGSGFMSWEKCDTLMTYDQDNEEDMRAGQNLVETTPDTRIKSGKDGKVTVEGCHKETPGSVISGSLNKQLGIPADSLNIADEINEIVGALFSQLVYTVLSGGLYTAGGGGNRTNPNSLVNTLRRNSGKDFETLQAEMINSTEKLVTSTEEFRVVRKQSYDEVNVEREYFISFVSCLNTASTSVPIQSALTTLNKILTERINPLFNEFKTLYTEAEERSDLLHQVMADVYAAETVSDLMRPSMDFGEMIRNGMRVTKTDLQIAKKDIRESRKKSAAWHKEIAPYTSYCPTVIQPTVPTDAEADETDPTTPPFTQ
jgi:hypothetical protein